MDILSAHMSVCGPGARESEQTSDPKEPLGGTIWVLGIEPRSSEDQSVLVPVAAEPHWAHQSLMHVIFSRLIDPLIRMKCSSSSILISFSLSDILSGTRMATRAYVLISFS